MLKKHFFNRRGFTLIEVLIVIAVIATVSAISFPAITGATNSLSKKQANDYAKSLFLAVQSNLAAKRVDGSVAQLSTGGFSSVYQENGEIKSDVSNLLKGKYSGLLDNDEKKQYVYITNSQIDRFLSIVPITAIDSTVIDGTAGLKDSETPLITVIFNQVTGDVLFVQYGEKGTFAGEAVNSESAVEAEASPYISIINDEECYIRVTIAVPSDIDYQAFGKSVSYEFKVYDANDTGKSVTIQKSYADMDTDDRFSVDCKAGLIVAQLSIDSLRRDKVDNTSYTVYHYASNPDFKDSGIVPGTNIKAQVKCNFNRDSYISNVNTADYDENRTITFNGDSNTATGNPLFGLVDADKKKILVQNGRNLQNLNNIDADFAKTLATQGYTVELTNSFSWGNTIKHYSQYPKTEVPMKFTPLKAEKLFAKNSTVKVNGNGKTVTNLYVSTTDSGAGLFEKLYVEVNNIIFDDPIVASTHCNVGVLASEAEGVSITGCQVFINTPNKVTGNMNDAAVNKEYIYGATYWGKYDSVNTAVDASVGLLAGYIKECTVTNCSISMADETFVPASSDNFGMLIGLSENSTVTGGSVSGKVNGGMSNSLGGAIGKASGGTYSNLDISGAVNNIVVGAIGGAIGTANGGSYSKINTSVDFNINEAFVLGSTGFEISGLTYDNIFKSEYGKYANPALVGYAGKFVGCIHSGAFSNCNATGTAAGTNSNINYANMQFVGVLKCTQTVVTKQSGVYQNAAKYASALSLSKQDPNYQATVNNTTVNFVPQTNATKYTYPSDITLTECRYFDSVVNKTKKQSIGIDTANQLYYYSVKENTQNSMGLKESTGLTNNGHFLFMREDGNGDYDILICQKKTITSTEVKKLWEKGQLTFKNTNNTSGTVYCYVYDSEYDATHNKWSYYLWDTTTDIASTIGWSYQSWVMASVNANVMGTITIPEDMIIKYGNNSSMNVNFYISSLSTNQKKYNGYKYYTLTKKVKAEILGKPTSYQLTQADYEMLTANYAWRWESVSSTDDTHGCLVYDFVGTNWLSAYLFIYADEVGGQQNLPVVVPYTDDFAQFFNCFYVKKDAQSSFYMTAEMVNGSLLLYRKQYIGTNYATITINSDTSTGVIDNASLIDLANATNLTTIYTYGNISTTTYQSKFSSALDPYCVTSEVVS